MLQPKDKDWLSGYKNKVPIYAVYKRQRRTLHNDQGINPRTRYKNCKYKCTQHGKTSTNKPNMVTVIK